MSFLMHVRKQGSNQVAYVLLRMQYRIVDGTIEVAPWPFGVESHAGYLVGYQLEGYPAVLEPVVLPYRLGQLAQ